MGWSGSRVPLKDIRIKKRILNNIMLSEYNPYGHLYDVDNDYIYICFQEPKNTDLWEDNKEYYIALPFRKEVGMYDKFLYKSNDSSLFVHGVKFNDVMSYLVEDFDSTKIFRVTFRR